MPESFEQVLLGERALRGGEKPSDLAGLSLSSGGMRSATFCLGVLQGMAQTGLFRVIDYMSSVGGGASIAGLVATRISRDGLAETTKHLREGRILLTQLPSPRLLSMRTVVICLLAVAGMIVSGLLRSLGATSD